MNGQVKTCCLCLREASHFKIVVREDCLCDGRPVHCESLTNHDSINEHKPTTTNTIGTKKHDLEESRLYCRTCDVLVCHYCVVLDHQEHKLYGREPSNNGSIDMDKMLTPLQEKSLSCLDDNCSKNSRHKTDLQSAIDEVDQSIEIARQMLSQGIPNHERTIVCRDVTMATPDVIPSNVDYINHVDDEHSLQSIEKVQIPDAEKFTISHVMTLGAQGELEEPVGVATTADGSIFVADHAHDYILVFDKHGQFVRTMTHVATGSGRESAFLCPAGLASDTLSGHIVIAERGRHRITIMSQHGRLQHKFGKMGKAHGLLRDPLGVCVDRRGRIIVADTANSRIQVFDKHGDFVFAFGNKGDHPLDYPNYAVYHQGLFIVSDTDNDSVKVFDKHGRYLRDLTDHKEGQFSAPSGLAVFKHHYVLVCDFNNDCVKMFTLDGQYVTKFGSEGSGPGQFSGPEAVSVTADNRIVVTDKNNGRVQVFQCQ